MEECNSITVAIHISQASVQQVQQLQVHAAGMTVRKMKQGKVQTHLPLPEQSDCRNNNSIERVEAAGLKTPQSIDPTI